MYVFLVPFLNSIIKDASDYLSQPHQQYLYSHSFQYKFTIHVSIKSAETKKRIPDGFKAILD